jgi:hypothetical protein
MIEASRAEAGWAGYDYAVDLIHPAAHGGVSESACAI